MVRQPYSRTIRYRRKHAGGELARADQSHLALHFRGCLFRSSAVPLYAEDGVFKDKIVFGQVAALNGPAQGLGQGMREGLVAAFEEANHAGGIHGRKLELQSTDDGYEPEKTIVAIKKAITEDKIFALVGAVGTPTSKAGQPIATAAKVPFVGPFTGAEVFRHPLNRYIFNVRASYFDETDKLVEVLAALDLKPIAVFYQNDAYGQAGLEGVRRAMTKRKLPIAATATVERNSTDVAQSVETISKAAPQAVIMISAYKSCAAFIRAMKARGAYPQFLNVSFVGSTALANELGDAGRGVGISQVVPLPWYIGTPVVKEYQRLLKASNGKAEFSFTSLEGFIAAKVMVEGLRRAGRNPTREGLITSLESMKDYDAGGFWVSYSPSDHDGSKFIELTAIGKDKTFVR